MISLNDIFGEDGAISDFKEDYKPRPQQIAAAEIVESALDEQCNALIEGGTGIGKSFAYLFPSLKQIADSDFNKKVVVVTSGISLQEQLVLKDIPFAADVMASLYDNWMDEFSYSLLKGRQNFVCLDKVEDIGLTYLQKEAISSNFHEIYDFIRETFTGDLSELNSVPEKEVLEAIACTRQGECKRKDCNFFEDCYYVKHRKCIDNSSLIVTNYHMLFSDLKVGGGVLPPYDILIFDEAHEAADIYRDFDGKKISVHSMLNVRNKISELHGVTKRFIKDFDQEKIRGYVSNFERSFYDLTLMYGNLSSPKVLTSVDMIPNSIYEIPNELMELYSDISIAYTRESDRLKAISEHDDNYTECSNACRVLAVIDESLFSIIEFINSIKNKIEDENEVVWVEDINGNIILGSKKIEIGEALNKELFEKENLSCIFTSATISTGGTFDYIKEQIGLKFNNKKIIEFIADSPFDLTKQQLWYLPPNTCDGNKPGFDEYACSNMIELADACNGGTLCLFTSIKAMRNARLKFDKELGHKYTILAQGDKPRSKLIEQFRDDEDSILLGTKSFFTGVDVAGNSLRCLIIDKFPFAQPTDPVQQELRLKDNAFYKYSIPDMIILLKQGIGRGVRSINDKCVISVLDGRMSTANYKVRVFNSFGYKKTSTRDIEVVKKFFSQE